MDAHALGLPVPPMPPPAARPPSFLRLVLGGRGDLLSLFPAEAYRRQVMSFRLPGRLVLVLNHPEVVREVFVGRHDTYQRKSRFMERALAPVIGDSLFINHGAVWAERRAVIGPELHPAKLERFHPLFLRAAEELAEDLARAAPGPVELSAALAAATARVVMLALFGERGARRADAAALAGAFAAYQAAAENLDLFHLLGLPAWLPSPQGRAARRAAQAIRGLIARLLAATPPGAGAPLLEAVRAARRPDGAPLLAGEALVDEVAMLLLAGSETAANALTWTLYLLAAHPEAERRVREELAALPAAPGADTLAPLVFTRAVLQEAMRLYPPVAVLSRQALGPDRIRRWSVRPGDTVLCVPWLLHRHAMWWEHPHAFLPERFLPEAARRQPKFTYMPFGLGPRVCAGAAFGMAEMQVFLAVLLRRLAFSVPEGFAPRPFCRLTLRAAGGMPLRVAPRR
ncbi:cytochrome P450 [Caldovatus aquaticus]|uniref:Cytochrome P450 n=1 Tax=Caldovatus aquaticus TaxID=2865671 RepID=A0ABS7F513_9PROT|nr:cytochrome P450 [Caldovatus aquaticus]MBW8270716.1 cytochrome P450 [Caldovatus aquaticus]